MEREGRAIASRAWPGQLAGAGERVQAKEKRPLSGRLAEFKTSMNYEA